MFTKTLRRIRDVLLGPKTPYAVQRARMIEFFHLGKEIGRKEALADLPITQVQPRQVTGTLHLPPGVYAHAYHEELLQSGQHPTASRVLRRIGVQYVPPDWINSQVDRVPTVRNLVEDTEHMPALTKALHQRRHVG